ncbi:hypothetical protein [Archangium lansingense]|uniref:Lipoprotein n=1 Tax=Archangium lansingense TaxID=2995310 RepID=A0ABT4A878_9BACT|nr:hypothetical protein [Archangium lansinium]MCY1077801.1 hypothetical protein [Archangium lansinium]
MSRPVASKPWLAAGVAVLLMAGCATTRAQPLSAGAEQRPASFINKVWKVDASPTIQKGQLYVFLSEGTLVIAAGNGTPSLGTWRYQKGALTMVEESIAYPVDILELTADTFRIRVNNPGEPVEMTLIPADGVPLAE